RRPSHLGPKLDGQTIFRFERRAPLLPRKFHPGRPGAPKSNLPEAWPAPCSCRRCVLEPRQMTGQHLPPVLSTHSLWQSLTRVRPCLRSLTAQPAVMLSPMDLAPRQGRHFEDLFVLDRRRLVHFLGCYLQFLYFLSRGIILIQGCRPLHLE